MKRNCFARSLFLLLPASIPFLCYPSPFESHHETEETPLPQSKTIVDKIDQISDFEARFELARLLSYSDNTIDEALTYYLPLFSKHPEDTDLALEISRLSIRKQNYQGALSFLYPAIEKEPAYAALYLEASRAERELGHVKRSEDLILKGLSLTEKKEPYLLDYADTLMLAGSFYKAKAIYEELLQLDPSSLDLSLKLGWNLVSSQRYEEAEGLYQRLSLALPDNHKVLEALAALKMVEKNFCAALTYIDLLLDLSPSDPSYRFLKADALYQNQDYCQALQLFESLLVLEGAEGARASIGVGKASLRLNGVLGFGEQAKEAFEEAYRRDPSSIEAQYYRAGNVATTPCFIQNIIDEATNPESLMKWAQVYAENGTNGIVGFQEAALSLDPEYYPAQIGLAFAFGEQYRYDEAIEHYLSILDIYPETSKILLSIARVLSWGKQYESSFEWYDRLVSLQPDDPVPWREKARAAYWGYDFKLSMKTYEALLNEKVDRMFLTALENTRSFSRSDFLAKGAALLSESIAYGSIYSGYQKFEKYFRENECEIEVFERGEIEDLLAYYLSDYLIQKSIVLESHAKRLDWQNFPLHALPVYGELAAFSPGNEEGLYGFAQDYCSLGLCNRSRDLYYHILNLDPNHNLVQMALQRNLLKENWLVQSNYSYWKERGLGQFAQSQIARHRFDEVAEWSPSCNFHLRLSQNAWIEFPYLNHNKYYPAEGQTIEVDKQLNSYIKGSAGAAYKNYFNAFPSRSTGFATVWFDCNDYFNLGIGYERRNEIYNLFSLKQGTQSNVYWGGITSTLTHYWEMKATYWHLDYNDSNNMDHVEVQTSYTFTDDPNVFKLILQGSYRNTAHLTEYIVTPKTGKVKDVIHPYWTPQDYYSNSITLEYRRNFAFFNYCEGPSHYLDIQITAEEDSTRNPSLQLAMEWRRDFMRHWGFSVKGMIHQSKLWNAEGAWVNVYYRF